MTEKAPPDGTTDSAAAGGAGGAGNVVIDPKDAGVTGADDAGVTGKPTGIEGDKVDLAKLQTIIDDRNAKGKQVVDLKAEMKALQDQIKSLKPLADAETTRLDAEKSELEKVNEKMTDLQAKLDLAGDQLIEQDLKLSVTNAGIAPAYVEVASAMLKKAKAADENLDVEAYMKTMKDTHGALFADVEPAPASTAGGPGAQTDSAAQVDAQIAALEATLKKEGPFIGREKRVELIGRIESLRYSQPKEG